MPVLFRSVLAVIGVFGVWHVAEAGDYADRTILGFSPDGSTFAFEEFGVQDGSGFAYANIYMIDTGAGRLGERHADPRHA